MIARSGERDRHLRDGFLLDFLSHFAVEQEADRSTPKTPPASRGTHVWAHPDFPGRGLQPRARQLTPSADWRHPVDRGSSHRTLLPLTLTALGVVYGDIGTSPLYAMRECFFGSHSVPPTHENVLGVLSLIIYSLLLVISIKYIAIVMRADNQGEGGILALTALLPSRDRKRAALAGPRPARHLRRRAALRRRDDHAGDHRARRGRRAQGRHAAVRRRTSCRSPWSS